MTLIDIDVTKKILKIEYKVEEWNRSIVILNETTFRVYVMLKKAYNYFNKFSICIKVSDFCNRHNHLCQSSSYGDLGVLAPVCINEIAGYGSKYECCIIQRNKCCICIGGY